MLGEKEKAQGRPYVAFKWALWPQDYEMYATEYGTTAVHLPTMERKIGNTWAI